MTVNIHGKEYVTVAERVTAWHEVAEQISLATEIVGEDADYITVKATVHTGPQSFTGHARSNKSAGNIEGQSPLEVAETSAVGRALGFAGFGMVSGIASADEIKAVQRPPVMAQKEIGARKPTFTPVPFKALLSKYMRDKKLTASQVLAKLDAPMRDGMEPKQLWDIYVELQMDLHDANEEGVYEMMLVELEAKME